MAGKLRTSHPSDRESKKPVKSSRWMRQLHDDNDRSCPHIVEAREQRVQRNCRLPQTACKSFKLGDPPILAALKISVLRMPGGKVMWDIFVTGYGPTKTLAASLDPEKRAARERDFTAMHEKYRTPAGWRCHGSISSRSVFGSRTPGRK